MRDKIDTFDAIQSWLDNVAYSHSRNVNTGLQYKFGLQQFCDFVGKPAQKILNEYERADEREFRRKYAHYLQAFIAHLSREGFAPNTIDARIGAIKSFFKYNDLPLAYVPTARKHVIFHNRDIEKEEILKIIQVSRPRDRAFFAVMAQSGLRPETLCSLKIEHIEPDFSQGTIPCKIDVPEDLAKGKYHGYFTFMAEESIGYLKAYLNKRANVTRESYVFTNHGSEDQSNPKSFSRIFARTIQALKQKGAIDYKIRGNRKPSELRLYTLRKYFKKHAGQMGSEESEFLMGHVQGVKEHYLPKNVEHYRLLYQEKAMPNLRLESSVPLETDKQIQELREENQALKEKIQEISEKFDLAKLSQDRIEQVEAALKKWESERALREQQTNQLRGWEEFILRMDDKDILQHVHKARRELKKKTPSDV